MRRFVRIAAACYGALLGLIFMLGISLAACLFVLGVLLVSVFRMPMMIINAAKGDDS